MCNVFNPLLEDVKRDSGFENGKRENQKILSPV